MHKNFVKVVGNSKSVVQKNELARETFDCHNLTDECCLMKSTLSFNVFLLSPHLFEHVLNIYMHISP